MATVSPPKPWERGGAAGANTGLFFQHLAISVPDKLLILRAIIQLWHRRQEYPQAIQRQIRFHRLPCHPRQHLRRRRCLNGHRRLHPL